MYSSGATYTRVYINYTHTHTAKKEPANLYRSNNGTTYRQELKQQSSEQGYTIAHAHAPARHKHETEQSQGYSGVRILPHPVGPKRSILLLSSLMVSFLSLKAVGAPSTLGVW